MKTLKFDDGSTVLEFGTPDSDGDVLVTMSDAYDNIDIFLSKESVRKLVNFLEEKESDK